MPMPRMSSGIRARCRLVMMAARHRSHRCPGDATDMHVAATRLLEIWRRFVVAHIFTGDV
jgi:hypothetical protein